MKVISVCRICLSNSATKDITKLAVPGSKNKLGTENKTGSEIFMFCLNIQIDNDSKISTKLCLKCFRKVVTFYNFKLLAHKNDMYLRDLELNLAVKKEQSVDEDIKREEPILEDYVQDFSESIEIKLELVNSTIEESDDELLSDVKKIKYEFIPMESENDSKENDQFETHSKKEGKGKSSKTQICDECGKSVVNLNQHMRTHKPKKKGTRLPCTLCEKTFSSSRYQHRHMKKTHLTPKKTCPICEKEVKDLQDHTRRLHDASKLPFECPTCKRRCISSSALDMHMITHCKTNDRPFQCNRCDKKFSQRVTLRQHMQQIHDKKVNHLCQYCSKGFFTKKYLQRHLAIHSDERAYKCKHCEKAFKTMKALKNHTYTHSEEKNFICTMCDMSFAHPSYLRAHTLTHTREKQYPCKYCDARFHRSDHRKRHEFTAHEKHLLTNVKN